MKSLREGILRVLGYQVLIAALTTAGFGGLQSLDAAYAALAGSVGAVAMTALLAFEVSRFNRRLAAGKAVTAATMVLGLAPRLLLVLALFWVGLQLLALKPLPMVAGFAAVYLIGYCLNYTTGEN